MMQNIQSNVNTLTQKKANFPKFNSNISTEDDLHLNNSTKELNKMGIYPQNAARSGGPDMRIASAHLEKLTNRVVRSEAKEKALKSDHTTILHAIANKIAYHTNKLQGRFTGICFTSHETMSKEECESKMSVRTLQRRLKELENLKIIKVERRGFKQSNKYSFPRLEEALSLAYKIRKRNKEERYQPNNDKTKLVKESANLTHYILSLQSKEEIHTCETPKIDKNQKKNVCPSLASPVREQRQKREKRTGERPLPDKHARMSLINGSREEVNQELDRLVVTYGLDSRQSEVAYWEFARLKNKNDILNLRAMTCRMLTMLKAGTWNTAMYDADRKSKEIDVEKIARLEKQERVAKAKDTVIKQMMNEGINQFHADYQKILSERMRTRLELGCAGKPESKLIPLSNDKPKELAKPESANKSDRDEVETETALNHLELIRQKLKAGKSNDNAKSAHGQVPGAPAPSSSGDLVSQSVSDVGETLSAYPKWSERRQAPRGETQGYGVSRGLSRLGAFLTEHELLRPVHRDESEPREIDGPADRDDRDAE